MKENLLTIFNTYGKSHQVSKLLEEVGEFIEAVINGEINHITEEISDVLVMLKQFQYYYGIEYEQIEEVMRYKINRQLERLNNKNNNTQ